jgi:hypothetical protein
MKSLTWSSWIVCVAVGFALGATPVSAQLTVTSNQTVFHPDETVAITVGFDNAGAAFSADMYVGARLPDGSAVLLTDLAPLRGTLVSLNGDPRSFPPLFGGFEIPEGSDVTVLASLAFPFVQAFARGEYQFFAALARAGALQDGRIDPNDLVAVAVRPLTFVDVGTGLRTAQIEVSPPSPTASDAISIRLSGQWPDSCLPSGPAVRITGSEVRIDTSGVAQGVACAQVVTAWELTVPVGQLPAGDYRVVVINASEGQFVELGRTAFEIQ